MAMLLAHSCCFAQEVFGSLRSTKVVASLCQLRVVVYIALPTILQNEASKAFRTVSANLIGAHKEKPVASTSTFFLLAIC